MMGIRLSPITQKRLRIFRKNRIAFVSIIALAMLFVLSLCAELIANDKPILARYKDELLFPALVDYPESKFGGFLAITDYKDPVILDEIKAGLKGKGVGS